MRIGVFLADHRLEAVNFIVGAAVLTFELTASRVVAPYIGTSIYVWTSIIGVILGALAFGYALGGRLADRRHKAEDVVLLLIVAAATLLFVNLFKDPALQLISSASLSPQWQALFASVLLFVLPTIVLGMISPYLVRLNITSVATSGRKVANIDAWGTLGALFGTFMTGYVLFGFVGTRNMLCMLALVLVLTSFVLPSRRYRRHQLLAVAGVVAMTATGAPLNIAGVIKDADTRYGRVMVRDTHYQGAAVRSLQVDQYYLQSSVYRNGSPGLVASYTRALAKVAERRPNAQAYLVIGGGAFTLPMHLQNTTKAAVDVVEIDGELRGISEQYFGFRPGPDLRIIATDGRQYLNANTKKYDVIFVDAYSSGDPPFQLFTKESAQRLQASLRPGGVVAANIISPAATPSTELVRAMVSTYRQAFSVVGVYRANAALHPATNQNLILLASNSSLRDITAGSQLEPVLISGPGPVLTDDLAPLERLVIR